MARLSIQHVYKKYDSGIIAVNDFCLDISDREFIILVGPSGSGKSTLLSLIEGSQSITEGEIYIGARQITSVPMKDRDIAAVYQNYALFSHMNVFDNIAVSLKSLRLPKDEVKQRVREAAKTLEIDHLLDRKPDTLSGGQMQRVALGRAIVMDPKVFLMDDPISNLDAKLRVQMRVEITKLHQRLQTTIIYATQDQTEAMTMGTRIVIMKDGFIQQVDSPTEVYLHPVNTFVAGFFGMPTMNFINSVVQFEQNDVYINFENTRIKLAERYCTPELRAYDGKAVFFGVRPEAITDEENYVALHPDTTFSADVDVVELLGAETYLYLTVNGTLSLTARVDPTTSKSLVGETASLAIDSNRIHIFDKNTEQSIIS